MRANLSLPIAVAAMTASLIGSINKTYDGNSNRTSVTDRNGHTTKFRYDVQNRLTNVIDALGHVRPHEGPGRRGRQQHGANLAMIVRVAGNQFGMAPRGCAKQ